MNHSSSPDNNTPAPPRNRSPHKHKSKQWKVRRRKEEDRYEMIEDENYLNDMFA